MSLSKQSTTAQRKPWVLALFRFNWIEYCVIPVAISLMEAQSILLVLLALPILLGASTASPVIDEASIILLLLGLQWWALLVKLISTHPGKEKLGALLPIGGLIVAAGCMLITHLALLTEPGKMFLMGLVVLWSWKRGLDWARTNAYDEHFILTFKISLAILLVGLLLVLWSRVSNNADSQVLNVLSYAFPLFFVSGLLGLSFIRLNMSRKEQSRYAVVGRNPLRLWLLALTILWLLVIVGALAFEIFSFNVVMNVIGLLWVILGEIVSEILYLLYWILAPLLSLLQGPATLPLNKTHPLNRPQHVGLRENNVPPTLPSWLLATGQVIMILLALAALIIVIRLILRNWHIRHDEREDEEEERETFSAQEILRQRRQENRRHKMEHGFELEKLDKNSARAQFRQLLQALADSEQSEVLPTRHLNETPSEYQTRLLKYISLTADTGEQEEKFRDTIRLQELTQAYIQERYAGRDVNQRELSELRIWLPQFIQRLLKHKQSS
ncbi:DUF4129 domain-containing protein [Ktedonosporobacter rubrisoli]|uniref:DUF4129 domain-containing protein n=1 Tax=Ktedonosporobacter rubrisoli TaxID=2509675 RepID=A0A4P6JQA1_KTERU|nr:DUF4129 domain-containing protein [Ktedonosporobacter rubrisoli]QBD77495.1 DUF4129 domain-containing protein [Ktedonosporobacter rubrisoli]